MDMGKLLKEGVNYATSNPSRKAEKAKKFA
jgi:hypothetical protein